MKRERVNVFCLADIKSMVMAMGGHQIECRADALDLC